MTKKKKINVSIQIRRQSEWSLSAQYNLQNSSLQHLEEIFELCACTRRVENIGQMKTPETKRDDAFNNQKQVNTNLQSRVLR